MYRAYKRTEIASYVRYTCFKVAVSFPEVEHPENVQFCDTGYPSMATSLQIFRPLQRQKNRK